MPSRPVIRHVSGYGAPATGSTGRIGSSGFEDEDEDENPATH
ncbi:MAG: hypothetical protein ACOYD3_05105 [Kiritimatiellia bacterium]|jgi:hypothetical protein